MGVFEYSATGLAGIIEICCYTSTQYSCEETSGYI